MHPVPYYGFLTSVIIEIMSAARTFYNIIILNIVSFYFLTVMFLIRVQSELLSLLESLSTRCFLALDRNRKETSHTPGQ